MGIHFCFTCKQTFQPEPHNVKNGYGKYCSQPCYWKSLRKSGHVNKDGYRIVSEQGNHYKEHRRIVEDFIGRKLDASEIIHHKDGNRLNNNISNLQIMSRSTHAKLEWKNGKMHNSLLNLSIPHKRGKQRIDL